MRSFRRPTSPSEAGYQGDDRPRGQGIWPPRHHLQQRRTAGALGSIEQTSVEDWDRTFAILLRGVFLGIKHSMPEMRKAGGGSIISTASIAGIARLCRPARLQRGQGGRDQPHPFGGARIRQGQDPRQLHLSGRNQHADFATSALLTAGCGPRCGACPSDSPRGHAGGYRQHGALSGQRRIGWITGLRWWSTAVSRQVATSSAIRSSAAGCIRRTCT